MPSPSLDVESAVRERYSQAAQAQEKSLCCSVNYDRRWLEIIPQEIVDRDYGCGDPSRHVRSGEVVLDLGSGGGKICYIAAQVVGPIGFVIGVDCNDDMLDLARRHRHAVGDRLGYHNVDFRKGRIQDLALNLDLLDEFLAANPARSVADWLRIDEHAERLREERPLVAGDTVDVIVSNCVLNLVRQTARMQLFAEMFRVLKPGGRAVISDIVASRDVPRGLQANPDLWSGCVSGAFREDRFLAAFADAGFISIDVIERQAETWQTIDDIDFRSVTVRAFKPQTNNYVVGSGSTDFEVLPATPSVGTSCCKSKECC
jgi:ubiquinone/menaquinone biosynthesis C-methylase UbiE